MGDKKVCTNRNCMSFPNIYDTDRYICWYCGFSLRKVNVSKDVNIQDYKN